MQPKNRRLVTEASLEAAVPDALKSGMIVSFGGEIMFDFAAGTMTLPRSTRVTVDRRSITVVPTGGTPLVVPIVTGSSVYRLFFDTTQPESASAFVIRSTIQSISDIIDTHVLLGTYALPHPNARGGAYLHGGPARVVGAPVENTLGLSDSSTVLVSFTDPIHFNWTTNKLEFPLSTHLLVAGQIKSVTTLQESSRFAIDIPPQGFSVWNLYYDTTLVRTPDAFLWRKAADGPPAGEYVMIGTSAQDYGHISGGPFTNSTDEQPDINPDTTTPFITPLPAVDYTTPEVAGSSTTELDPTTFDDIYDLYDALPTPDDGTVSVRTLGYAQTAGQPGVADTTRPIREYHYAPHRPDAPAGTKIPRLLIQSGLHGYEKGIVLATYEWWKDLLFGDTPLSEWIRQNIDVHLVPVANPWGYDHNTRANANRVDLNRSFPAYWSPGEPPEDPEANSYWGGPSPMSELEAQVLDAWYAEFAEEAFGYIDLHNIGGAPRETSQGRYGFCWLISGDNDSEKALSRQAAAELSRKWRNTYPELAALPNEIQFAYASTLRGGTAHNHVSATYRVPSITCDPTWGSVNVLDAPKYSKSTIEMNVDTLAVVAIGMIRHFA